MAHIYFEVSKDNEQLVRELREDAVNITELMNSLLAVYKITHIKKEPLCRL
jgi:hypothetical protein